MPPQSALAFKGTICHTPTIGSVEVLQDHLLVVNSTGNITHLGPADTPDAAAALQQVALQPKDIHTLSPTQFLLPGFIDTHCHAPQYAFTGTGTDLALFEWLNTYTFPCEAKFGDRQHAEFVYSRLVQRLLRLGTTTSNYFTTVHVEGCKVLADTVVKLGQRAVLGKVCMDQHSPEHYVDHGAQESLQGAREMVQYIQAREGRGGNRVWEEWAGGRPAYVTTCTPHYWPVTFLGDVAMAGRAAAIEFTTCTGALCSGAWLCYALVVPDAAQWYTTTGSVCATQ
jgi:guanine deaminase